MCDRWPALTGTVGLSVWPGTGRSEQTMSDVYVHGYHPRENERLGDQAGTLEEQLHHDTRARWPPATSSLPRRRRRRRQPRRSR